MCSSLQFVFFIILFFVFVFSQIQARISSPAGRQDVIMLSDRWIRSRYSVLRQRGTKIVWQWSSVCSTANPTHTRAVTHSVIKTKPLQTWHDICHPGYHHRSGLLTSRCHGACSDQEERNSLIGCGAKEKSCFIMLWLLYPAGRQFLQIGCFVFFFKKKPHVWMSCFQSSGLQFQHTLSKSQKKSQIRYFLRCI